MKGIFARPHVQGSAAGIEVETTKEQLTDGAGLAPLRMMWDRLEVGRYLDTALAGVGGRYRTPGKLVWHARRLRLKLMSGDPLARLLERAGERVRWLRPVPLPVPAA